ncbi:FCD domain-containing protein [Arcanobacterium hippocoleae]|uniref:FCD domain-containing protein n=1 Tax=Arcanobacterium hippocoleae TaxID=149017 RepID=UPI00333EFE76
MKGTENPQIWAIVETMTAKAKAGETYFREDIEFHSEMLRCLGNNLIQQLMSAMWLIHQTTIPKMKSNIDRELKNTAGAHRKMLAAAEAGDLASYIEAIEQHYAPLEQLLKVNQQQH